MICSTSESVDVLYAAARGVGFDVAAAKQAAVAAVWLETNGQRMLGLNDGFAMMLEAVKSASSSSSTARPEVTSASSGSTVVASGGSIIDIGPCVLDMLVGDPDCGQATLTDVAGVGLFVGMALSCLQPPMPFSMWLDREQSKLVVHRQPDPTATVFAYGDDTILLSGLAGAGQSSASQVDVAHELWTEASTLALATHVPSSEASRLRGAGAGLTDND